MIKFSARNNEIHFSELRLYDSLSYNELNL